MTFLLMFIGRYGFRYQLWEYDLCVNSRVLVSLSLHWGDWRPRKKWAFYWRNEGANACLEYHREESGKLSGWRLQGPLQRVA